MFCEYDCRSPGACYTRVNLKYTTWKTFMNVTINSCFLFSFSGTDLFHNGLTCAYNTNVAMLIDLEENM